MEPTTKLEVLSKLKSIDGAEIIDTVHWPQAYCKNLNGIKAVVLGCDPSNSHDRELKYAFGIDTHTPKLKQFFLGIQKNLRVIGLSIEDLYVQNLCQNYFADETSKNKKWKNATAVWIPYLKEELDSLPISRDVPVFLTAVVLYQVLLKKTSRMYKPQQLYSNPELLPIKASDNLLERPLFPLYRGGRGVYELTKWQSYRNHLNIFYGKKIT